MGMCSKTLSSTRAAVKPLNPRSPDTKYTGLEPTWRVQPTDDRTSQLSAAFSWYNYFYGKKDAREIYKDLTTTETPFNGRGTENLVVLKAW